MTKIEKIYSMPQLAKRMGLHRTTLKRLEDRGVIPQGRLVDFPFKGRAYTEAEAVKIEAKVREYLAERKPQEDGAYHVPAGKVQS